MPDKIHCGKCGMDFRVHQGSKRSEVSRCSQPGCQLKTVGHRFWSGYGSGRKPARVGVFPDDVLEGIGG